MDGAATLDTVCEVLALYLAVWITVKHYNDIRQDGLLLGTVSERCQCLRLKLIM
jgi:hypothetical protein